MKVSDTKLKMGDFRITVNILKSGQARAYADTVGIYRMTIEWIPYDTRIPESERKFVPYDISEQIVRQWAKGIYGWVKDKTDPKYKCESMEDAFAPTLTHFERIDKGIWEWTVSERFTD